MSSAWKDGAGVGQWIGGIRQTDRMVNRMNHDAAHCLACDSRCPEECYRAQLVRELRNLTPCYPFPVAWSNFEGTNECLRGKKDAKMDTVQ